MNRPTREEGSAHDIISDSNLKKFNTHERILFKQVDPGFTITPDKVVSRGFNFGVN